MYDPTVDGETLNFGISGWLYQSTAILYDRKTLSLWSQIGSEAISGDYLGSRLQKVAARDTTWGAWRAEQPDTLVLSQDTGHDRSYGIPAYAGVQGRPESAEPTVPVTHQDPRLPNQTLVFGIELNGATKAYPIPALAEAPPAFTDEVGGRTLHFTNDPPGVRLIAAGADGTEIPYQKVYWYAWAAFHPGTAVYEGPAPAPSAGDQAPS